MHQSTEPDDLSKSKTFEAEPIQAPESPLFRMTSRPRLTMTAPVPCLTPNTMPVDPFAAYQPLVKSLQRNSLRNRNLIAFGGDDVECQSPVSKKSAPKDTGLVDPVKNLIQANKAERGQEKEVVQFMIRNVLNYQHRWGTSKISGMVTNSVIQSQKDAERQKRLLVLQREKEQFQAALKESEMFTPTLERVKYQRQRAN